MYQTRPITLCNTVSSTFAYKLVYTYIFYQKKKKLHSLIVRKCIFSLKIIPYNNLTICLTIYGYLCFHVLIPNEQ